MSFFQFHIEIEGKCGWMDYWVGGAAKRYVGPPLKFLGVGLPPPPHPATPPPPPPLFLRLYTGCGFLVYSGSVTLYISIITLYISIRSFSGISVYINNLHISNRVFSGIEAKSHIARDPVGKCTLLQLCCTPPFPALFGEGWGASD